VAPAHTHPESTPLADNIPASRKKIGRAVAHQVHPMKKKLAGDILLGRGSGVEYQQVIDPQKVIEEIETLYYDRDDFMKEARERILVLLDEYKDVAKVSNTDDSFAKEIESQINEAMDDYVQCTEECDQVLHGSMEKYADVFEFYPEKRKELQNKISVSSRLKSQQMVGDLQKYSRQIELTRKSFLKT